jgi:hypothetical protein
MPLELRKCVVFIHELHDFQQKTQNRTMIPYSTLHCLVDFNFVRNHQSSTEKFQILSCPPRRLQFPIHLMYVVQLMENFQTLITDTSPLAKSNEPNKAK